jgi:hypothetical protein
LLAHTRVRRDRVDKAGCFTLRHRSKLHHVAVGRAHKGKRVLVLVADLDIRVIDEDGVTRGLGQVWRIAYWSWSLSTCRPQPLSVVITPPPARHGGVFPVSSR